MRATFTATGSAANSRSSTASAFGSICSHFFCRFPPCTPHSSFGSRPISQLFTTCISKAEKSTAENLCRCTGYRSIADTCKSFAYNVDIEDLGLNSFWRKEDIKEVKLSKLPSNESKCQISRFLEFLKEEFKSAVALNSKGCSWYSPTSIKELQDLFEQIEPDNQKRVKLVVSNTGTSYYKELEKYDKYIDLRHVPELSVIQKDEAGMHIGAAVTISKAIASMKECSEMLLWKIANHLEKVASNSIRNSASIGGNLVMAQRNCFPSDIATLMLVVNCTVDVVIGSKREIMTFEEFLKKPPLDSNGLLVSVTIPSWKPNCETKLLFETYRAAPRPLGNALPSLNAAFLAEVSTSKNLVIKSIRLAFGAYGSAHAVRARAVEDFLMGRNLKDTILFEAVKLIRGSMVPEDESYTSSLAAAFLFQFLHLGLDFVTNHFDQIRVKGESPILLPAKQAVGSDDKYHPVGDSLIKTGAALQASGEAIYVDDIPSPEGCFYGAFIYSTMPRAWIKDIKFKSESFPDGVVAVISCKDIPNEGQNVGSKTIFSGEPLFAEDLTSCAGQRIALVVRVRLP